MRVRAALKWSSPSPPAPQSPALGLGGSSGGSTGLLPWGPGPPVVVRLECGSAVGDEGAPPLAGPVPPPALALASQLHGCLLVLPLDHLVVLPVLQVGSELRVLGLLGPLPRSVTLDEGGAAISSGALGEDRGPSLQVASEERKSFKGQLWAPSPQKTPSPLQAQVSESGLRWVLAEGQLPVLRGDSLPRLPAPKGRRRRKGCAGPAWTPC